MYNSSDEERLLERAVNAADQTRLVRVGRGVRHQAVLAFEELFGQRPAVIVADSNTFAVAGRDVVDSFRQAGHPCLEPFVFEDPDLHAEYSHVESIARILESGDAIPVAVGSGTINDMTKLAAHHLARPYLCVATAASMDGYTAFGASITRKGSKQTLACQAPSGVLADLEVIETAPEGMNASGYADLLAKVVAGADWLVADALQVEPIDPTAWEMMHSRLRQWLADPNGIRRGDHQAVHGLICGLLVSGLAMQWMKASRVASGAEHQFSHVWDMQNHVHSGRSPAHGFKVGIGTLASSALYEQLLPHALNELDVDSLVAKWPELATMESVIGERFSVPAMAAKAAEEVRAKYIDSSAMHGQLERLRSVWPDLRTRLRSHLLSIEELTDRLSAAGCPVTPQQIGISPTRLRESYHLAYFIRRRFTVLDLAARTQLFEPALEEMFGAGGRWPIEVSPANSEGGG